MRRPFFGRMHLTASAAAVVALLLYWITLNPTFGFIDKGELVAAASTLGIPHPTGYPTITMLGYLFTKLIPTRPVFALNLLSALLSASGVYVLAHAVRAMLVYARDERRGSQRAGRKGGKEGRRGTAGKEESGGKGDRRGRRMSVDETALNVIAAGAALFVGATATWWNQANGFEVYSLHALLMPLTLLLFLRYLRLVVDAEARLSSTITREHFLFALILGLAFTNHLTIVLLAPGLLAMFFWSAAKSPRARAEGGWVRLSLIEIARLVPGFLLGLLPYLYLPLRASRNPRFNWGDPETLKRFVDHVRGRQYAVWMGSSGEVFEQQTAFFFGKLPSEVAYIGLVLAAVGIFALARRSTLLSAAVALFFAFCVLWAGSYDILEIEPYFMLAILALGIWCAFGARWLAERFGTGLGASAVAGLALLTIVVNYPRANESENLIVEQMTRNVLGHLPRNALIISAQWDFWVSGSWYMQAAEGLRPDVAVIDQELLRRSWYLDQMEQTYPDIMGRVRGATDRFRKQVRLFEYDLPYNPAEIQAAYIGMINAIIDSAMKTRSVFVTGDVAAEMGAGYERVPNYLALRLVSDSAYVAQDFPSYEFSFWPGRVDHYGGRAYELYARSSYARALYESEFGNDSIARRYLDHALTFDPGWDVADVPDQALNGEEQSLQMIEFFAGLRAARARAR